MGKDQKDAGDTSPTDGMEGLQINWKQDLQQVSISYYLQFILIKYSELCCFYQTLFFCL